MTTKNKYFICLYNYSKLKKAPTNVFVKYFLQEIGKQISVVCYYKISIKWNILREKMYK